MSRIGIIGYNSINLIKKVTEIWNAGNSVVLIDPLMPVPMQFEIMRMTKAELCFIDDSIYQKNCIIKAMIVKYRFNHISEPLVLQKCAQHL